ncbi:hypothetical protein M422DRAFT_40488 [Sphaerobolus stellatus SS14]|nr:hypothetical protein M422DRAFT_40488 [Sphaerobolus stellatus SS14]
MVFTNLSAPDKQAFFALLDEYFASRPELAEALQIQPQTASNPAFSTGSISDRVASFTKSRSPPAAPARPSASSKPPSSFTASAANPDLANAIGRVAAASRSLNVNGGGHPRVPSSPGPNRDRPLPPQRSASVASTASSVTSNSSARPMPPPPVRKVPASQAPSVMRRFASTRARTPTPEPEETEEPEAEGEWAEALYDYTSADPNDLPIKVAQRVWITEKTSDDWWTGEVDGKSGLFPAAYVKLL